MKYNAQRTPRETEHRLLVHFAVCPRLPMAWAVSWGTQGGCCPLSPLPLPTPALAAYHCWRSPPCAFPHSFAAWLGLPFSAPWTVQGPSPLATAGLQFTLLVRHHGQAQAVEVGGGAVFRVEDRSWEWSGRLWFHGCPESPSDSRLFSLKLATPSGNLKYLLRRNQPIFSWLSFNSLYCFNVSFWEFITRALRNFPQSSWIVVVLSKRWMTWQWHLGWYLLFGNSEKDALFL